MKASVALNLTWTPLKALMIIISVVGGGFIFIAVNLLTCVVSFWIVNSVPITRLVFDNHLFAQYPLTIYPKAISIMLAWIVPYGLASYYPASFLLDRDIGNVAWVTPLVAAFLLFMAYRFWEFGLKHYHSTGT